MVMYMLDSDAVNEEAAEGDVEKTDKDSEDEF